MPKFNLEPQVMGLIIGLLLAILLLTFGFWQTLLVIIFAGVGWLIGWAIQVWNISFDKIKRIFSK
ncbi:hypothetical protein WOSG25_080200 [Weissella oryzae SG25]|uniref:Small integral membrane protein n=1 Tax=Weissella oryzae (strain DSM 25784 / JCM 18191 / LMG 30913 / SG25) TaxID=1329250 RepID=A0A069CVD4_WEIOS|nr:DUF2273 domain-containing protein [Weissella oryzae]GAK31188.1 hypothetical protein WOSG25_080200 [Weissella oryzae SG25]